MHTAQQAGAVPGSSHRQPCMRPPFCVGQTLCTCTGAPWTCLPRSPQLRPGLESATQQDLLLQGDSRAGLCMASGWLAGGCSTTSPHAGCLGVLKSLRRGLVLQLLGYLAAPQGAAQEKQGPPEPFLTQAQTGVGLLLAPNQGGEGNSTLSFRG